MKKLKFVAITLCVFGLTTALFTEKSNAQEETPCIICGDEDEPECQRVIRGNKVDIYYGVASPCIG
jgi:3D (Asp-Asp-Asp) domain-containing protein